MFNLLMVSETLLMPFWNKPSVVASSVVPLKKKKKKKKQSKRSLGSFFFKQFCNRIWIIHAWLGREQSGRALRVNFQSPLIYNRQPERGGGGAASIPQDSGSFLFKLQQILIAALMHFRFQQLQHGAAGSLPLRIRWHMLASTSHGVRDPDSQSSV